MSVAVPAACESPSRLLTVGQVAKLLNLGVRTVHRFMADGRLPRGVKLGGARRIDAAELQAFIARGCKPAAN